MLKCSPARYTKRLFRGLSRTVHAAQRGNRAAIEEYQNRLGDVWKKYDCNPFKSILGVFAQAPLFIGFFSALRAMALHKVPCHLPLPRASLFDFCVSNDGLDVEASSAMGILRV